MIINVLISPPIKSYQKLELQLENKIERLESIQNPGNYVTFSPEFSNKTIWKKVNLINQIVYKAGFLGLLFSKLSY